MADSEKSPDEAKREYRWTLALFALVAAATAIWFQLHIEPYVAESLIIGGTISLWGLWKLIWSKWEFGGGQGGDDITRKFLGKPGAWKPLAFAAGIVALLYLTTSSIYLRGVGSAAGEGELKLQVFDGDQLMMGNITLHPGEVVGHPTIPSYHFRKLTYRIVSPRGFATLEKSLYPWSAHDIDVPGDFRRKTLHPVVLAPDVALFSDLPKQTEPNGQRYYLAVNVNGAVSVLDNLSQQLVLTGAAAEDLPDASAIRHDDHIRQSLGDHFAQANIDDPGAIVSGLLDADMASLGSAEFKSGATIEIEVGIWKVDGAKRTRSKLLSCRMVVPDGGDLRTWVIGETETKTCKTS